MSLILEGPPLEVVLYIRTHLSIIEGRVNNLLQKDRPLHHEMIA